MDDGEADEYPVTIWRRLREGPLLWLFCAGLAGLVLGTVLSNAALETMAAYGSAVAMMLWMAALAMEYRADARYLRSLPEVERDDA